MTITEVSKKYDLTADTIRYYERIGLIPRVNRNKSGVRDFKESDCNWIEFIKCMRGAGLPIEALIDYVNMFQQGEETRESRKELLIDQRKILAEKMEKMKQTIYRLDYKISLYEEGFNFAEKDLKNKKDE